MRRADQYRILMIELRDEHDVVQARQRVRQVAALLNFDHQTQTRIATATSEVVRNAYQYAGSGTVELRLDRANGRDPDRLAIVVRDQGPGIANLDEILNGNYHSTTGMGLGIVGARRLMDRFHIESRPGSGTTVTLEKDLPPEVSARMHQLPAKIAAALARAPQSALQQVQEQNRELLRMLEELRQREAELERLNRELEDTNRGVVALYAELDDRADYLQRANEVKTKFLSNMSHEFRTPLNTILSLSRIMIESEPPLEAEQLKQASYIRKSAQDLSDLVNDLLDLAKVEAGKLVVRPHEFDVADLFGVLRGMLRPLLSANSSVDLVFEDPKDVPLLYTDEGKVSQILRNLISNALKFTERGEVRVSAHSDTPDTVTFVVQDTGIGVAPEDHTRIFEEWTQIENELQSRYKGTGLGLPLSRRLAQLLGGEVTMESREGVGSTFYARISTHCEGAVEPAMEAPSAIDPQRRPVLFVDDNRETLFIYEKYLEGSPYQQVPARTLRQAREVLSRVTPAAIVLDVLLERENSWGFLAELKHNPATRHIPTMVVTMVDNHKKAEMMGANAFCTKPCERAWLLGTLNRLTTAEQQGRPRLLIVDDEDAARYILRASLPEGEFDIAEARSGAQAFDAVRQQTPAVIFLDLMMPGINGFEVARRLKANEATSKIPIVISSAKRLTPEEEEFLADTADALLAKDNITRETVRAALARAGFRRRSEHLQQV